MTFYAKIRPLILVGSVEIFQSLAGIILSATGLLEVVGGLSSNQMLDMADPVFGESIRTLMLLAGGASLIVGYACLFKKGNPLSRMLACWLAINMLLYRSMLWKIGWHDFSGFMVAPINLLPGETDVFLCISNGVVFLGAGLSLWTSRKARMAASFVKMSCPGCGVHIRFPIQNLGQTMPCPQCKTAIKLRKPENLKMACYFCREHIEFPAHALGEKIKCPHCRSDITLKESA